MRRLPPQIAGILTVLGLLTGCSGGDSDPAAAADEPVVPAPAVSFTATPSVVPAGGMAELTWSSTHAAECAASGDWSGARAPAGSERIGPLERSMHYSLTCTGDGGAASAHASVSLASVPSAPDPAALPSFELHDAGNGGGTAFTIGLPLAEGTLRPGVDLVVTDADGHQLPSQWNPLATWRTDGSVMHGALTFVTGPADSASGVYRVGPGAAASGSVIGKADVVASGFDAAVNVTIAGSTYGLSARALLDGTVKPRRDHTHYAGPLSAEFSIGGPLRRVDTGQEHATLQAHFYVRAFDMPVQHVYATVVLENTGAFKALADVAADIVDVRVGGVSIAGFPKTPFTVYSDVRYQKRAWWPNDPGLWGHVDLEYLQRTHLVPSYRDVKVSESRLAGFPQATDWNERNALSGATLASGGSKPELAPYDRYTAAFLISGDRRAWNAVRSAQDEYAFMVHTSSNGILRPRDEATGMPIDLGVHAVTSQVWGAAGRPGILAAKRGAQPRVRTNLSHLPAIGYVPYLLTAESNELENLQFSAASVWLNERPGGYAGTIPNRRWGEPGQPRSFAWGLREIVNAGSITPDGHPLKPTLEGAVTNALEQMNTRMRPLDPTDSTGLLLTSGGSGLGIGYSGDQTPNPIDSGTVGIPPWMNDWFAWSLGTIYQRGWRTELDATGLWHWKAQGVVARFGTSTATYCWEYATPYAIGVKDTTHSPLYEDWKQIFSRNWPDVTDCKPPGGRFAGNTDRSATDYGAQIAPALAVAVETGIPGASDAWDIYDGRDISIWTPNHSSYGLEPEWAIEPGSIE